jgi:hypothetical protein
MRPDRGAPVVATLEAGTAVPVLGRYDGYLYVVAPSGHTGWLEDAQQPE